MKTVEQIEKLSKSELDEYLKTLTDQEKNQMEAEFYLVAARHFRKPGHCFEKCELKLSRAQYNQLDAYFLMQDS